MMQSAHNTLNYEKILYIAYQRRKWNLDQSLKSLKAVNRCTTYRVWIISILEKTVLKRDHALFSKMCLV